MPTVSGINKYLCYRLSSHRGRYIRGGTGAAICSRMRASLAPPPLMPAFLSYAFFFRQKESVKKRTTKLSFHKPRPRQRDLTYLIQTTIFACLKNQSVAEVRFRDNFSVTSILIIIANSGVTENSSRTEFDSGFFSSQQPLRRLSRYAAQ